MKLYNYPFTFDIIIAIVIHIIIIILTFIGYLYNKNRNSGRFNIFLLITIFFSIFYGFIPIFYILEYQNLYSFSVYVPTHVYISNPNRDPVIVAAFLEFISYSVILFVYSYRRIRDKKKLIKKYYISKSKVLSIAFFFLLVSTLAILVYVQSMGGLVSAVVKAELFRAHNAETSNITILRYVMPFIQFSSLVFFSLYLGERKKKYFLFFLIAFLFSVLFLLLNAGRSGIVVFFAMLLLTFLDWKRRFNLLKLLPLGIFVIILVIYGDPFFVYLATGRFSNTTDIYSVYLQLIRELSPVYVNNLKVTSFSTEKGILYFFEDIFVSTIKILPQNIENIFGNNLKGITEIHTKNFSPPPGTGIIVDAISYGYYQFALPGVIVVAVFWGILIRKLDNFFLQGEGVLFSTLLPWTAFFIMGCMISLEINTIILTRAVYWFPLLFFIFYSKKRIY